MRPNPKRTRAFSLLLLAASLAVAQPPIKKQPTYKISGHAAQGALVALYGPSSGRSTTVPNTRPATGAYQFTGVAAGTYTVQPSIQGCNFDPAQRTVTVTNADVSGVDFAITCPPPGGRNPGPNGRGRG